jgi:MoaD family protein
LRTYFPSPVRSEDPRTIRAPGSAWRAHGEGVPPLAVEVKIPTILRSYTDGSKAVPGDGANLAALLDDLETRYSGLKARLITDDGSLHRFVNIYVNDEDVRFTGSLDTTLSDGDSVTILPAVAGGSF